MFILTDKVRGWAGKVGAVGGDLMVGSKKRSVKDRVNTVM
jgi:hypothetical protein